MYTNAVLTFRDPLLGQCRSTEQEGVRYHITIRMNEEVEMYKVLLVDDECTW